MKRYRTRSGEQRLWFQPDEIEATIERELLSAGLMPTPDAPVTDVERFVEAHLGTDLDQYAELEPSVLGLTQFAAGASPAVSINRDLTGSALDEDLTAPGLLGRWRATMAHEAAHVVLHRGLFDADINQTTLFDHEPAPSAPTLMRCLKRDVGYASAVSDWREVQANLGMASLLMPRRVFHLVVDRELESLGASPGFKLTEASVLHRRLVSRLADEFGVSRQAAAIRLRTVQRVEVSGVGSLLPAGE
jgi:hypothetical protein